MERGDQFTATTDYDGYPAVRVHNRVWVDEDRWITVSATDTDQEHNVRALAAALVAMADAMRTEREAVAP